MVPNRIWHMAAYISYLVTDDLESMSSLLHFGNDALDIWTELRS